MNYKRKSRRRSFLLMRSRTPPISSEFRGGGGLNTPNPSLGTPLTSMLFWAVFLRVYEVMLENTVERGRSQMTIWRMRIACWVPKATNTHSGCVIHIAFPLQHCFAHAPQCYVIRTLNVLFHSVHVSLPKKERKVLCYFGYPCYSKPNS